jgi:hypothetical protein
MLDCLPNQDAAREAGAIPCLLALLDAEKTLGGSLSLATARALYALVRHHHLNQVPLSCISASACVVNLLDRWTSVIWKTKQEPVMCRLTCKLLNIAFWFFSQALLLDPWHLWKRRVPQVQSAKESLSVCRSWCGRRGASPSWWPCLLLTQRPPPRLWTAGRPPSLSSLMKTRVRGPTRKAIMTVLGPYLGSWRGSSAFQDFVATLAQWMTQSGILNPKTPFSRSSKRDTGRCSGPVIAGAWNA